MSNVVVFRAKQMQMQDGAVGDGGLEQAVFAPILRSLEDIIRTCQSRVATVPAEKRPRVYYTRGPRGLDTALGGSINIETIEFMGVVNVAGQTRGGLASVSLEQVLAWDPEVIITIDQDFTIRTRRCATPIASCCSRMDT
jgi:iron complex transport system substrate-binding protein